MFYSYSCAMLSCQCKWPSPIFVYVKQVYISVTKFQSTNKLDKTFLKYFLAFYLSPEVNMPPVNRLMILILKNTTELIPYFILRFLDKINLARISIPSLITDFLGKSFFSLEFSQFRDSRWACLFLHLLGTLCLYRLICVTGEDMPYFERST